MARTAQPAADAPAGARAQRSESRRSESPSSDPRSSETATSTVAPPETRACPTRMDGGTPLFQHQVTVPQCMSKQRKLYHKCFTCAHLNGRG